MVQPLRPMSHRGSRRRAALGIQAGQAERHPRHRNGGRRCERLRATLRVLFGYQVPIGWASSLPDALARLGETKPSSPFSTISVRRPMPVRHSGAAPRRLCRSDHRCQQHRDTGTAPTGSSPTAPATSSIRTTLTACASPRRCRSRAPNRQTTRRVNLLAIALESFPHMCLSVWSAVARATLSTFCCIGLLIGLGHSLEGKSCRTSRSRRVRVAVGWRCSICRRSQTCRPRSRRRCARPARATCAASAASAHRRPMPRSRAASSPSTRSSASAARSSWPRPATRARRTCRNPASKSRRSSVKHGAQSRFGVTMTARAQAALAVAGRTVSER